jgi:hypothetical protein
MLAKRWKFKQWYGYGAPSKEFEFEVPLMNIFIYWALDEAKQVLLNHTNTLFLEH